MPYKPSEVASVLDVSVSTIRSWTAQYGEFLTASARGETGDRKYTDADMTVLQYVAQLRTENMSRNAIALRLRETRIGNTEILVPAQPTETPAQKATEALQTPVDAAQVLSLVQYIDTRLQASERSLDERLDAMERRQQAGVNRFIYGVVVGFGAAILLLAIAYALQ